MRSTAATFVFGLTALLAGPLLGLDCAARADLLVPYADHLPTSPFLDGSSLGGDGALALSMGGGASAEETDAPREQERFWPAWPLESHPQLGVFLSELATSRGAGAASSAGSSSGSGPSNGFCGLSVPARLAEREQVGLLILDLVFQRPPPPVTRLFRPPRFSAWHSVSLAG